MTKLPWAMPETAQGMKVKVTKLMRVRRGRLSVRQAVPRDWAAAVLTARLFIF
jgi:hypothetical protein